MSQPIKVERSIHPTLQGVLSSLDVQLEEELSRYRRQRPPRIATNPAPQADSQPVESAPAAGDRAPLPPVNPPEPSLPNPAAAKPVEAPNPQSAPNLPATAPKKNLVDPQATQPKIEDYLESSEQLLRSVSTEEAKERDKDAEDSVLSPLGVGAMLLLLLSSASMGYLLTNPATLSRLGLDRFWKRQPAAVAQSPSPASSFIPSATPPIGNGPNLAEEEFSELNLNNLSTIKTSASPSPTPVASAIPTITPSAPAVAVNPKQPANSSVSSSLASNLLPDVVQPVPSIVPLPGTLPPQPSPAASVTPSPVASAPANKINKAGKGLYFVLVDYDGDRSLAQARKAVRDAYLQKLPEGMKIQMGAFPKEGQAQRMAEDLKKRGLPAFIYRP